MALRASSGGPRAGSDATFAAIVFAVALVVTGLGVYFIGRGDGADPAAEAAAKPTVPHHAHHAHRVHHGAAPSPSTPASPSHAGATTAGAIALVRRNFALSQQGDYAAACALESPAYLRFDAQRYAGGCVGGSRTVGRAIAAQGVTPTLTSARLTSFGHGKATVTSVIRIGTRSVSAPVFVQYRHGRWWVTGAADSGDVGY